LLNPLHSSTPANARAALIAAARQNFSARVDRVKRLFDSAACRFNTVNSFPSFPSSSRNGIKAASDFSNDRDAAADNSSASLNAASTSLKRFRNSADSPSSRFNKVPSALDSRRINAASARISSKAVIGTNRVPDCENTGDNDHSNSNAMKDRIFLHISPPYLLPSSR
jgi:hypothetical protein